MTGLANYYFIPTVREGLAACLHTAAGGLRSTLTARLTPSASESPSGDGVDQPVIDKEITLFGPADVVGLAPRVVTRSDPRPNIWDFEPNFLPFVEFGGEPDLPWRFSAAAAAASPSGELNPWISLIVLRSDEFEELRELKPSKDDKKAKPTRWIHQAHFDKLPDLSHAAKWAHVQVTAGEGLVDSAGAATATLRDYVSDIDPDNESHVVSRLICPRRLTPSTKYTAFIIPTFKAGWIGAGLLETLGTNETAITIAWDINSPPSGGKIDIPYYYKFEFGTSVRGDFEYLVRLLEPRALPGLGRRPMDASSLPYGIPGLVSTTQEGAPLEQHFIQLEGALKSPGMPSEPLNSADWQVGPFQTQLAQVLNLAATHLDPATRTTEVPKVVPPVYGSWHSGNARVNASQTDRWKNDVNLDPRQRAAAGFGALIVERDQEALMASVWDQLGNVDEANQIVINGQLGLQAANTVYRRLGELRQSDFLWMTAPMFGRISAQIGAAPRSTIASYLSNTSLPAAAFDPAFRRLLRRRGGIRKVQSIAPNTVPPADLLSRLNSGDIAAAGPPPDAAGMPSICAITDAALDTMLKTHRPPSRQPRTAFRIMGFVVEHATKRRLAGVRVQFFVKGRRERLVPRRLATPANAVGSAITDERGDFVIDIERRQVTRWLADGRPDVTAGVGRDGQPYPHTKYQVLALKQDVARVLVMAEVPKEKPRAPSRANDFCEEAITCDVLRAALGRLRERSKLHATAVDAMCDGVDSWLAPETHVEGPQAANLAAVAAAVKTAILPSTTIPARLSKRLKLGPGVRQKGILGRIESAIEFPQPMYEPLAAISSDLVLPGLQTVPQNTISIVETNRRFVESYMLGLNHSLASEVVWRGAPVIPWSSYFRQFWEVDGLADPTPPDPELLKDIQRFAYWSADTALGSHDPRGDLMNASSGERQERAVILVRGQLFLRYPQTLLYAVQSRGDLKPELSEHTAGATDDRIWPIFGGSLAPDLTFFGFDMTADALCTGGDAGKGHYIVLEERLGEPRFGFDLLEEGVTTPPDLMDAESASAWFFDVTWENFSPAVSQDGYINGSTPGTTPNPQWSTSAATVANACLQRPVRVAIHASRMLDKSICIAPTANSNGI